MPRLTKLGECYIDKNIVTSLHMEKINKEYCVIVNNSIVVTRGKYYMETAKKLKSIAAQVNS